MANESKVIVSIETIIKGLERVERLRKDLERLAKIKIGGGAVSPNFDRAVASAQRFAQQQQKVQQSAERSARDERRIAAANQRAAESLQRQRSAALIRQFNQEQRALERSAAAQSRAAVAANRFARSQGFLSATLSKVNAGLGNSGVAANRFSSALATLGVAGGGLAALGVGAVATAGAIFGLAKRAAEAGSRVNDLSIKTGLSAETLSGLDLQLQQSGSSLESLSDAVFLLQKNLGAAAGGNDKLAATFRQLGIEDAAAALENSDATFRRIVKRLFEIEDAGRRNAVGAQVFGRAYKQLSVFMEDAGGDIDAVVEKSRKLGLVISQDAAAAADKFGDDLDQLQRQLAGLGREIGGKFIPVVSSGVTALSNLLLENRGAITGFFDLFVKKLQETGAEAQQTYRDFKPLIDILIEANTRANAVISEVQKARPVRFGEGFASGLLGDTRTPAHRVTANQADLDNETRRLIDQQRGRRRAATRETNGDFDFGDGGRRGRGRGARQSKLPRLENTLTEKQDEEFFKAEQNRLQLQRTGIEQGFNLTKDGLEREQAVLDQRLEDRLVSVRAYYTEQERVQTAAIDAEISKEKELSNNLLDEHARREHEIEFAFARRRAEIADDTDLTPAEKAKSVEIAEREKTIALAQAETQFSKEYAAITERIIVLLRQREQLTGDIARNEGKATDALQAQIQDALNEINELSGRTSQTAITEINRRFNPLLEQLRQEEAEDSPLFLAVTDLVSILSDRARIAELVQRAEVPRQQFELASGEVQQRINDGLITEREARAEINALQKECADKQLVILRQALSIAEENRDAPEILRLQKLIQETEEFGRVVDEVGQRINQELFGNIEQGFADIFSSARRGIDGLTDALISLAESILDQFNRLAAQSLTEAIFGSVLKPDAKNTEGTPGGFLAKLFGLAPAGPTAPTTTLDTAPAAAALTAGATTAGAALTASTTAAGAGLAGSVTAAGVSFGASVAAAGAAFATAVAGAGASRVATTTAGAGFAGGGEVPAKPGGRLILAGEGGYDELVLTTDPKHYRRSAGLLGEYLERTNNFRQGAARARDFAAQVSAESTRLRNFKARLPAFEAGGFVLSARVAQQYLLDRLDAPRLTLEAPRLNEGILRAVPDAGAGLSPSGGQAPVMNARIINQFDSADVVGGHLATPAGTRDVLNIIARNAPEVGRMVRIR